MILVRRTFLPSKLNNLLNSVFLSACTHTKPVPKSLCSLNSLPTPAPQFTQNPPKTLFQLFFFGPISSQPVKIQSFPTKPITRDGNYDDATSQGLLICPGCGVQMQDSDPKQPGFFILTNRKTPSYKLPIYKNPIFDESEISDSLKRGILDDFVEPKDVRNLDNPDQKLPEKPLVCARCHSLRYYGSVKDPSLENLLPDFDFDHTVGRRLMSISGARTVVLMVVDASDFDGSFPRKMAKLVSETIDENSQSWKEGKSGNVPRIVLVLTKIDLLPCSLSPTGLEHWARTRARQGGASKLTSVHLVSAVRDWGIKNLVDDVVSLAGSRGHVWAIGAQNAGKSTLINAIGKSIGGKVSHLTEAPVPGTTLGIVRVEGVLPGNAKLFDTPGILHAHQISTRLTREEQKLVHISKRLKPRTYRIKVGHSIHIGGLVRLDIEELSTDSLYITVWASPLLPLHMGRTENASFMMEEHFGRQLQPDDLDLRMLPYSYVRYLNDFIFLGGRREADTPPIGEERVEKLGKWVRKEFHVRGNWWDTSCVDIAAAGLGWFAIGLRGEALLGVWTYDGVDIIFRDALLPQRSRNFEVAGFTVSKIVSRADQASNKQHKNRKQRRASDSPTVAADASSATAATDASSATAATDGSTLSGDAVSVSG